MKANAIALAAGAAGLLAFSLSSAQDPTPGTPAQAVQMGESASEYQTLTVVMPVGNRGSSALGAEDFKISNLLNEKRRLGWRVAGVTSTPIEGTNPPETLLHFVLKKN